MNERKFVITLKAVVHKLSCGVNEWVSTTNARKPDMAVSAMQDEESVRSLGDFVLIGIADLAGSVAITHRRTP